MPARKFRPPGVRQRTEPAAPARPYWAMTPATTPFDANLPPPGASAGHDGLLMAPTSTGAVWASLGEGFARFFASRAQASDAGESMMDSPSL